MPRSSYPEALPRHSDELNHQIDAWLDAMRWQRVANRALWSLGITHTQFIVLMGAASALGGRRSAVSQSDIADAAGLDASTTSVLVTKLAKGGYLDKGPHGLDPRQTRILMTSEGYTCLSQAIALLEAAALGLDEMEPSRR